MEKEKEPVSPFTATVRRNPPRKARPATSVKRTDIVPSSKTTTKVSQVSSFPLEEILSMEVPKMENQNPNSNADSVSESLRVFLRIRPLVPLNSPGKNGADGDRKLKSRAKNVWPKNPTKNSVRERNATKKKSSESCITVNDSQSVTLSPPLALQDSKRVKSEVYEGFSHIFDAESSQEEVYEKMVNPLVEDFLLRGKSGMLAALGPSGSGKTHTVFGCPRDPGVVPRMLRRIFEPTTGIVSELQRSFKISIFEINSERGKGEKLFDLLPGGAELSMHQSNIKGLQEVIISDAVKAESLVAHALARRVTAMTNTNSQSSRSQCIINIRSVANDSDREDDYKANNAVLSIIDLAGAEREKRTGNQGARLVESNFINNTSMVFGLCLRSLLEHQKNPKRPLQKHFQNSLLTRYLRNYLEGKKRMTLILTVKSGEEDYLDATYLLRQASPFMRIRFDNVEEPSNNLSSKRHSQALPRNEQPKRMKLSRLDSCVIEEEKISEDEHGSCEQEASRIHKLDMPNGSQSKSNDDELAEKERNCTIWQNVATAFWKELKKYKEKLKVAEHEIQDLTENLKIEKTRYVELKEELGDLKSFCTCSQQMFLEVTPGEAENELGPRVELSCIDSNTFDKSNDDFHTPKFKSSECTCTSKKDDTTPRQDQDIISPKNLELRSFNLGESESNLSPDICDSTPGQNQDGFSQVRSSDVEVVNGSSLGVEISQQKHQLDEIFSGSGLKAEDLYESKCSDMDDTFPNPDLTDLKTTCPQPAVVCRNDSSSEELDHLVTEVYQVRKDKKLEEASTKAPCTEQRVDTPSKPEKPKRRLLPASSALRDFCSLDIEDNIENPKGNRAGKKYPIGEIKRTQGSISLIRMLHNKVHA
ncbi:hypothetical protein UlMin_034068 [Ulmus minor]